MSNMAIDTVDGQYTYTSNPQYGYPDFKWKVINNNKVSDTQGFLRKVEKGDSRIAVEIYITDTKANIEANLYPMLTYPSNINVTFDRTIPTKTTSTATFTFEDYEIKDEFTDGGVLQYLVTIKITEVLP